MVESGCGATQWAHLLRLREIEEDDDRGIANRGELVGEGESAGLGIDSEGRDIVASLIAGIEKRAGGIEVEAAGIVAAGPFFAEIG